MIVAYNVKTSSLSCIQVKQDLSPGDLSSTASALHTLRQANLLWAHHALHFCACSFLYPEGILRPTWCCTQGTLFSSLRWAQMSSCLWNPFWLWAELVTPSSGFHITYRTILSSLVCFAPYLPPSTTSSWKARSLFLQCLEEFPST